jgi:hypothetical protein
VQSGKAGNFPQGGVLPLNETNGELFYLNDLKKNIQFLFGWLLLRGFYDQLRGIEQDFGVRGH